MVPGLSSTARGKFALTFAADAQVSLPRISCTRINRLLVRLIRGKSCRRPQQMGQDFPRGVLVYAGFLPPEPPLLEKKSFLAPIREANLRPGLAA